MWDRGKFSTFLKFVLLTHFLKFLIFLKVLYLRLRNSVHSKRVQGADVVILNDKKK